MRILIITAFTALVIAGCGGSADEPTPEEVVAIGSEIEVSVPTTETSEPVLSESPEAEPLDIKFSRPGTTVKVTVINMTNDNLGPVQVGLNSVSRDGDALAPESITPEDAVDEDFVGTAAGARKIEVPNIGAHDKLVVTLLFSEEACVGGQAQLKGSTQGTELEGNCAP